MNRPAKLALLLTSVVVLLATGLFVAADFMGIGPNFGLPFGYYGKLNQILARVEANPKLEVQEVTLHRDTTLEDFYITVRTPDDKDVRLTFEGAAERPVGDLLKELKKVGM